MEEDVVLKETAERGKKLVEDVRQRQEDVTDSDFSQGEAGFLKKRLSFERRASFCFFYHFVVKADLEFFITFERNFDETLPCSINDYI